MPAVSVIVPVYNTEKYLEECIRSLTEQTLSSLELIFVDDGSTDASPKILERYRARDPEHIRVITQKNAGQGKARNVGLAAATGEYVGFVDSDDYVDRRMYAAMYTRAGSEELDLVECDFHYLEEDGREKRSYGSAAPWNKLIRRRLLTDNDIWFPEGYIYEDTSFYLKLRPFVKKQAKMLGAVYTINEAFLFFQGQLSIYFESQYILPGIRVRWQSLFPSQSFRYPLRLPQL